jgi:predicted dinucleotide-binding enzyme
MEIAIIGTGLIGTTLGRALATAGHHGTYGSRHPEGRADVGTAAKVSPIGEALSEAQVVILAIPGSSVADLTSEHAGALAGQLVIDATNRMGEEMVKSRSLLPSTVRYVRAFNTIGGENIADPMFAEGRADMFFSGPEEDRTTVETIIDAVGLRPVYVGADQEALIDALFQLWVILALGGGAMRPPYAGRSAPSSTACSAVALELGTNDPVRWRGPVRP